MTPPKSVLRLNADWVEVTIYRAALEKVAQWKEPWHRTIDDREPHEIAQAVLDQFPRDEE